MTSSCIITTYIITTNILCSLHNSQDYDFYESFENHSEIT